MQNLVVVPVRLLIAALFTFAALRASGPQDPVFTPTQPVQPRPQEPTPAPAQPQRPQHQQPQPAPQSQNPPAAHPPVPDATEDRAPQGPGEGPPGADGDGEGDKAKEPRRGIPVEDPLVHAHCARCHKLDDKLQMTRVSYVRKSPEGWSESIKRMIRLHGLQLSPADAKQVVRSLANSHGLARTEAERGLYESERRVHWSEEQNDQDFKRACSECHTLGRVLLQQRDDEEWQLLRATHVAMFPLARGQMGGGPPDDENRRFGGGGGGGGGGNAGAANNAASGDARGRSGRGATGNTGGGRGGDGPEMPTGSVGDRVLQKLSKDQPLFSPAWDKWTRNRREVPLAGTWTAVGHETGRGDLRGTVELKRTDEDEYDVRWMLDFADGSHVERSGKGLLYAGYSWRGRCQDPGADGASWREVLLLDETWQSLRGRLFTGAYDEIGVDVTLHRDQGRPRVLAVANGAIAVPSKGHRLEVIGEGFPAELRAADFFVGEGLTVTAVERQSDRRATLVVDAAAGATLAPRSVAFGATPGTATIELYDTVDYVRIRPLQGLARIGGARHPKQMERFEAYAVNRGPDKKPFTDDDIDLFQVRPRWSLEEFRVRDGDDDVAFVGTIDPASGVFTPNVDGPNTQRKWQANNVGDVFVTAQVELDVPVRPPEPKPEAKKTGEERKDGKANETPAKPPEPTPPPVATTAEPPKRESKTFHARAHLIVTVPLYARWQSLDWEAR